MQQIYQQYGCYTNKTFSTVLPGKHGLSRMAEIMKKLREQPPMEIGGLKVVAIRDYLTRLRTENGVAQPIDLPKSNVLYFELEGGNWVCVRPSGTEPKIKLYINAKAASKREANELNEQLHQASACLLA